MEVEICQGVSFVEALDLAELAGRGWEAIREGISQRHWTWLGWLDSAGWAEGFDEYCPCTEYLR